MTSRWLVLLISAMALAQDSASVAKAMMAKVSGLRKVADEQRGEATRKLAAEVRAMAPDLSRTSVATNLAFLSTEGDFGMETLQQVADTLAQAMAAAPPKDDTGYKVLAELERLEHVKVTGAVANDPRYAKARAELAAASQKREKIDFALKDMSGKTWKLSELRGKVVLVNLWATWCPPCRKEMPDLDALAKEFAGQGLMVLGLTDEEPGVVRKFLSEHPYGYNILLDEGSKVNKQYDVTGIPKSFVYGRDGKIVAESIDMRTMRQFRELLAQAGLK